MTPDLKELERLARAATPGPWTYDGDTWELSAPSRKGKVEIATIETGWTEPMESEQQANIAYILAANPAAILSLIAELEQARKDAERFNYLLGKHSYHYSMQPDSPAEHGIEYQWQQGSYEERDFGILESLDAAIAKEQV